ncbi:hypothetical protein GLOIN_2v1776887 [Rhizophagus clarus]|uniref:Uncharacterized protein n=1 Tax=Rhizophagus clarus TaxID=94130 RepID=A0A8H3QUI7_9GLOM|nr:hypothetical protein GLOIN_2v1776887 [Rhizophagus clarus]
MACSKIFSELPELSSEIIKYFQGDFSTIHSCILVDRLCFIKDLRIYQIGNSIEKWVAAIEKIKRPIQLTDKAQNLNFINFIFKSLIKLFIENEAILHTFSITSYLDDYFDISSELILQNSNFIYNIKHLDIHLIDSYGTKTNDINPLLKFLSSNCNSISSINFPRADKRKADTAIKCLSQLINSQKDLKKICFTYYFPHSILLNSNGLNNLNTITFSYVCFENINGLTEVFEQLNALESIHIFNCFSLDSNFVQQMTKPFKLKTLFVGEMFESIELLLQKSGDYLENFGFQSFKINEDDINDRSEYNLLELESQLLESESILLELITKYCTKIKFFELLEFNNQNIYSAFNLIENIKQSLNYLSIDLYYNFGMCDDELGSIVLRNLGQILPFKLEYLNLSLSIDLSDLTDFEIFLKNSQNTFIKKLLFYNIIGGTREKVGQDVMINYIKEYIMKEERVKYLAFQNLFTHDHNQEELFYLEDEVKEFKLHNITVQKYNDLYIIFSDIIK